MGLWKNQVGDGAVNRRYVSDIPRLLFQWDAEKNTLNPDEVTSGSNKKVWWLCDKGHSWEASVKNRSAGRGCPYCSGRRVVSGVNDLVTVNPELATQWDTEKNESAPESFSPYSNKKVWWRCDEGHSWEASIARRSQGSGCPYCSNRAILPGFNDLESQYPEIASQWDYEKNDVMPSEIGVGSTKKVWWLCDKGHNWEASMVDRVAHDSGCPHCNSRAVTPGVNDLATVNPELASEWDTEKSGGSPEDVHPYSSRKAWWMCEKGHSWQATVANRSQGSSCPYCSGRIAIPGENDIATVHPEIVGEWDFEKNSVSPSEVKPGSGQYIWWKCSEGHSWKAFPRDRIGKGNGCPHCASNVSKKERELSKYISEILPDREDIVTNSRSIIAPKELDIYVPSRRIAIEFNGLYWHSEEAGKDRHYHCDKWESCKEKGIQLITVWEDQWRDNPEVVKSMLRHKLGASTDGRFYARNTTVKEVPLNQVRSFCEAHHIQGFTQGSVYLGAYNHDDELIAVSVWRKNGDRLYLDRYCTSATVVGGMGKLLKAGKRWAQERGCTHIVTFSDHEVSDGGLYQTLGFTLDKELKPDYRYVVDGNRVHKFNYRLKKFRNDPNLEYQEGLSERELALLNGIPRVWDCGKTRWVMEV